MFLVVYSIISHNSFDEVSDIVDQIRRVKDDGLFKLQIEALNIQKTSPSSW